MEPYTIIMDPEFSTKLRHVLVGYNLFYIFPGQPLSEADFRLAFETDTPEVNEDCWLKEKEAVEFYEDVDM